jgi:nitrogen fixation NifU-like protein
MTGGTEAEHDAWQTHSLTFLEMAFRTDRQGRPANWSGMGHNVGACKDSITFFVKVRGHIIETITYELDGCLNTNACANTVAAIAEGRDVDWAWKITPEIVSDYLQTLPADHFHCAELAVGAFYKALADYQQNGNKDWKSGYRRPA